MTAGKVGEAEFGSIVALAAAPIRELIDKAGLDASTASKIVRASRKPVDTDSLTKQLYER